MKIMIKNEAFSFECETNKCKTRTNSFLLKSKIILEITFVKKVSNKKNNKFLFKKICSLILKVIAKLLGAIIVKVIMNGLFYKFIILGNRNDFFIKEKVKWQY
jgi:hypothetical protein